MKTFKEILIEGKKGFKVGQKIKHKDWGNEKLTIVKLLNDNDIYNTAHGVAGITVKDSKGEKYNLWFDTETLRIKKKPTGTNSDTYKKITFL